MTTKYWIGKKFTEEHRKNISKALKGKTPTNFDQIKAWNKGLIGFGKGHPVSEHTKKRVSETMKGKPKTKEQIEKIRQKKTGVPIEFSEVEKLKRKERWTGKNNPRWNPETPFNKKLRDGAMMKIWKNAIFLRDNFTCQNPNCEYCGNKIGVFLHAHHIKPFSKYPELRFSFENGITYCKEFHINKRKELHQEVKFGKIKNSEITP